MEHNNLELTDFETAESSEDNFLPLPAEPSDFSAESFELALGVDEQFDLTKQPGFNFPAILLSNVKFINSLEVLQSVKKVSNREVDVWVDTADGFDMIGQIQLSLPVLRVMKYLGFQVTAYYAPDFIKPINLSDPEVLIQYV